MLKRFVWPYNLRFFVLIRSALGLCRQLFGGINLSLMSSTSFHTFDKAGVANSPALLLLRESNFSVGMVFRTMRAKSRVLSCPNYFNGNTQVFSISDSGTFVAPSTCAIFGFIHLVAAFHVWMTSFAVSLVSVIIRILSVRYLTQVVRIAAKSVSTFKVVKFLVWKQFAYEQNPSSLVSTMTNSIEMQGTVSFSVLRTRPVPTSGIRVQFNFLYESFNQWFVWWHKKSADLDLLNWPCEMATNLNRLLKLYSSHYSKAVQSLCLTWQKGTA